MVHYPPLREALSRSLARVLPKSLMCSHPTTSDLVPGQTQPCVAYHDTHCRPDKPAPIHCSQNFKLFVRETTRPQCHYTATNFVTCCCHPSKGWSCSRMIMKETCITRKASSLVSQYKLKFLIYWWYTSYTDSPSITKYIINFGCFTNYINFKFSLIVLQM